MRVAQVAWHVAGIVDDEIPGQLALQALEGPGKVTTAAKRE
jgi:hypothetical protein